MAQRKNDPTDLYLDTLAEIVKKRAEEVERQSREMRLRLESRHRRIVEIMGPNPMEIRSKKKK